MTVPWTLAVSIAIVGFLMVTRVFLGASGTMANSDHVTEALAINDAAVCAAANAIDPRRLEIIQ